MANKSKKGYEYLWAAPAKSKFELDSRISPYIEINMDFLNGEPDSIKTVKVNPYLRFNKIFSNFLNYYDNFFENEIELEKNSKIKKLTETGNNTQEKKLRKNRYITENTQNTEEKSASSVLRKFKRNLENKALDYLREMDFISGTTVVDIICERISEEIKNGVLGKNVKKFFLQLNAKEQEYISLLVYNQEINRVSSMNNFKKGIKYFFYDSIIYKEKIDNKKIIIFVNKEKNKNNIAKIKILEQLFLEFGLRIKVFWKNHFGVIDVQETMELDKVSVF